MALTGYLVLDGTGPPDVLRVLSTQPKYGLSWLPPQVASPSRIEDKHVPNFGHAPPAVRCR